MKIGNIKGATRVLADKQPQYQRLPILDHTSPELGPHMVSQWEPDAEDKARIMMGAPIHLSILGTIHPPVLVFVGEVPKSAGVMDVDGGTGPSQELFNFRVKLRAHPHAKGKFVQAPNEHNARQVAAEQLQCSIEDVFAVADDA